MVYYELVLYIIFNNIKKNPKKSKEVTISNYQNLEA
jgi:hypothetical protein